MNKRSLLRLAAAIAALPASWRSMLATASAQSSPAQALEHRVRPGDRAWPSHERWQQLRQAVEGRLIKVTSPLNDCRDGDSAACDAFFRSLRNPYFIGDDPALTQTSGWLDAWTSFPSAYAVAARSSDDVVASVNFAREHRLRVVVKGGGHSYQGTSNAPDSLLIWTRQMKDIVLRDAFVAQGCEGRQPPQPAVTVGAGAIWGDVYDAVTTRGGRYVQGGGCLTVGIAGLIQSGGFGSFSKNYGLASAALLEAEIVTADGVLRIANPCTNADLFWAIKGGGGGSLGVLTKLTLRTRELPTFIGAVFGRIKASSDAAFRDLIEQTVRFYSTNLLNPHWGEQIILERSNAIRVSMLFQGLDRQQAEGVWKPFRDALALRPEYSIESPFTIMALPARHGWDAAFFETNAPEMMIKDDRSGAPQTNTFWAGDGGQAGQFLHAYKSAWLPASLLQDSQRQRLVDALFESSRHWQLSLHFNKGLSGAPPEEVEAARDTAMNPEVLDAFALAIMAGEGPPAFPGVAGHEPDLGSARTRAAAVGRAMDALLKVAPNAGSYLSESDFFEREWQRSFWGTNYPRLAAVKKRYDPEGLFIVHHGVGSEEWSRDGFARLSGR